jgi:DNA-binding beta-propeller fold protein YncE
MQVKTVVGTGWSGKGGEQEVGENSPLSNPQGLAMDDERDLLYIAEFYNRRVRVLSLTTGVISTAVGGGAYPIESCSSPRDLSLASPVGLAVGTRGELYVVDQWNHRIVRIPCAPDRPILVAGSGRRGYSGDGDLAVDADLNCPCGVAVAPNGNVYVADEGNGCVRRINAVTGVIETVIKSVRCSFISWVLGGLLLSDPDGSRVLFWAERTRDLVLVAGTGSPGYSGDGGPAHFAELDGANCAVGALDGRIYIADKNNHRLRCVIDRGSNR